VDRTGAIDGERDVDAELPHAARSVKMLRLANNNHVDFIVFALLRPNAP
jgi:hypothetical protein